MNKSDFDNYYDSGIGIYGFHYKIIDQDIFYIILGEMYLNHSDKTLSSSPNNFSMEIDKYKKVIVQVRFAPGKGAPLYVNSFINYLVDFEKDFHNEIFRYIMPLDIAEDMFDCFCGNMQCKSEGKIEKELQPQPCCRCGMNDKWNSINNGKWYCYQHCSY